MIAFLNSANAPYVAELFFKYKESKKLLMKVGVSFFSSLNEDELSVLSWRFWRARMEKTRYQCY